MLKNMKYYLLLLFIVMVTSCLCFLFIKRNKPSGKNIRVYTAFFDTKGFSLDTNNEIKQLIAEITGAECDETWLDGISRENAIKDYIVSGNYPDFVQGCQEFLEAGALIPIDQYWEKYPNIYNYLSQDEWDNFRQEDGHIYWIPQFGVMNGKNCETIHQGEAFWIQTRVLKWAGYPNIRTVEEYFLLLENYINENPEMENGKKNIAFTILCDDWRYFCMENVPQFLDGYPNDGCCIVDPLNKKVMDYNITPTAKKYFGILNKEFKKGIIDSESFTSTYDEYLEKLSTGVVLGMVDQWWSFAYDITASYERLNLRSKGCDYVPLPITISRDIKNQWHVDRSKELDISDGLSVTVTCKDINGALQFVNDLLSQEVQNLRFWGVEGEDYEIGSDGMFYKTQEQRIRTNDIKLQTGHFCMYSYFPRKEGMSEDGMNAFSPENQASIFFDSLPEDVKECFKAYGCKNYVEMLGNNESPGIWYPMYSYSSKLTYSSKEGYIWKKMNDVKRQWLPRVIMADDFDKMWKKYMKVYSNCKPEVFLEGAQMELERRLSKYTHE